MEGIGITPFPTLMVVYMTRNQRARIVFDTLQLLFPEPAVPLHHRDPYTLLIAVLLSAQCTDERVNQVTPALFTLADNPRAMVGLSVEQIREIIRPCGLSPAKSKNIWNLSAILLEQHGGKVPANMEALEALPGVGHKTASVVMIQAFGVPAFPVDTHIHRLAQVWGLTDGKHVQQTEADLKALYPAETWNKLHLQIIYYGREVCQARQCDRLRCELCRTLFPDRSKPFKAKKP
jgi:endonuclease III